ncbi:glycogenin glucosyltransferase [Pseudocyphellaria aurata]|nr:glycogenin glucosyltransferase [Pseudocyphellaria aurata]
MAGERREAYCTLLMSDDYLPGAMVLGHSLRDNGTRKPLVAVVTLDTVQVSTVDALKTVYDQIIPVDRIVNKSPANLYLMNRPDLVSTFTKIALWRQTQFKHLVYLDADVVVLRAPDELFDVDAKFAAVPDIGWPDCFNSGVLSLKPNMGDYYALLALAQRGISFDGADQGLLNTHFRDWHRLSFTYNCTPSGNYQYVPAYRHFQSSISMVHYIGNDKPWVIGREGTGARGVYEELLGRWWSVYDKHYRASTIAFISGQSKPDSRTVQQYVKGESSSANYGYSSAGPVLEEYSEPEAPVITTEKPLTEKTELIDEIHKGEAGPIPTAQQRRYSADWDPLHQPPPINSRPEASNFPSNIYSMSEDPTLFQPPAAYPEPPKGMYYEVPTTSPAGDRPKPIFPWESDQRKPTRVFADDLPRTPPTEVAPSVTTDDDTQTETEGPPTPVVQATSPEPFASYARTNAWDEMPEIERYISNLPQNRRGKLQVVFNNSAAQGGILSPGAEEKPARRPSMKLTDFPTEIERPSLPVTPAPVRRPTFWGEERDAAGELPGAEGVPEQSEWDPTARLAELQRRQSEVLAQGPASPTRAIPDRVLPGSTAQAPLPEEPVTLPSFGQLNFAGGSVSRGLEDETVLSPIESTG